MELMVDGFIISKYIYIINLEKISPHNKKSSLQEILTLERKRYLVGGFSLSVLEYFPFLKMTRPGVRTRMSNIISIIAIAGNRFRRFYLNNKNKFLFDDLIYNNHQHHHVTSTIGPKRTFLPVTYYYE